MRITALVPRRRTRGIFETAVFRDAGHFTCGNKNIITKLNDEGRNEIITLEISLQIVATFVICHLRVIVRWALFLLT